MSDIKKDNKMFSDIEPFYDVDSWDSMDEGEMRGANGYKGLRQDGFSSWIKIGSPDSEDNIYSNNFDGVIEMLEKAYNL